ncbi:MAG: VWA domain-containing protein [Tannerella sp.]|jgi:Ca-activated chloride channel family protein|nr:VWA domain-containing protein [Tannerella sp.]
MSWLNGTVFEHKEYLLLLLLLIPFIAWYIWKVRRNAASLQVSSAQAFELPKTATAKVYLRHIPFALRTLAIALLIVVLARPQSSNNWQSSTTEGIDIMLAVDISGSMLAEDLKPNRLEAAKNVAAAFINGRPNDNIGLVVFAGESFTQCPLTTDHAVLLNLFKDINSSMLTMLTDGTAIGMGLANAVSRIKDSQAKSKVIILLTDGSNNRGEIFPSTAAEIAKTFGVRVYTIGVGTKGEAPYPFQTANGVRYMNVPVEIDEPTLQHIASMTGGQYFRATDNASLKSIYAEIDQMEKTKINIQEYSRKQEEYKYVALAVFCLLLLEILLRYSLFRKIP